MTFQKIIRLKGELVAERIAGLPAPQAGDRVVAELQLPKGGGISFTLAAADVVQLVRHKRPAIMKLALEDIDRFASLGNVTREPVTNGVCRLEFTLVPSTQIVIVRVPIRTRQGSFDRHLQQHRASVLIEGPLGSIPELVEIGPEDVPITGTLTCEQLTLPTYCETFDIPLDCPIATLDPIWQNRVGATETVRLN